MFYILIISRPALQKRYKSAGFQFIQKKAKGSLKTAPRGTIPQGAVFYIFVIPYALLEISSAYRTVSIASAAYLSAPISAA